MIDNIVKAATCRVMCENESGTGHLIAESYILTARHCILPAIESERIIELTFFGSEGDTCLQATIKAHSEELDACILSISQPLGCQPIPLNTTMPREGDGWRSFGYPSGKTTIGHRISGTVSHLLENPKLKMDIDLSVDPSVALSDYRGLSGAALVSGNASRGMIRLKLNGSLGAISIQQLEGFLAEHEIQVPKPNTEETVSEGSRKRRADRSVFQKTFEQAILHNPGNYIFLEGAHGIGKTTFCSEFQTEDQTLFTLGTYSFTTQGRGPGAIYHTQPEVFFDWLSTTLSTLITGKPSRKEERNYVTLVRETPVLFEAFSNYCASTHRHGILFLDGLNEAQAVDSNAMVKLLGLLPQPLPHNITIILTAPNYQTLANSLSGRVKSQNLISLPLLSDEVSSSYCWQELLDDRANAALVTRIVEKAKGHPLYLRYLIEYANSSSAEDSLDDFPILSGAIEEYYESLWTSLLTDENAINLLAIIARLRWGIRTSDLPRILTSTEQTSFTATVSRIRHLLCQDTTTIYHPSFAEFLTLKTVNLETTIQRRLADFCFRESDLDYCALNLVFHLLRSDDTHRSRAVAACDQNWVDRCVTLGVEPDTLLFDIEGAVATATRLGPPVEAIRLLLLSQRIGFRYNVLFAQSARLVTEALICLKRPREALKHVIRFNNLIVDPNEALQIALNLIQHEYSDEALELLKILQQRIFESYHVTNGITLDNFIHICRLHLRTLHFMRLADGYGRMHQVIKILDYAKHVVGHALDDDSLEIANNYLAQLHSVGSGYFLCFRDTYASLADLKEIDPDVPILNLILPIIWTLFECETSLDIYNLPKNIQSLPQVFSDIEELVTVGANFDGQLIPAVLDSLIQLGAPSEIVQLIATKDENLVAVPQSTEIRAKNRVDVDFPSIHRNAEEWRTKAFIDSEFDCPIVGAFEETGWQLALNQCICALFWCEGKARRSLADGDQSLRQQTLELLKTRVLQSLEFSLAQRVKWEDSYAIPENLFPLVYERIALLLMDCYPEELPTFLGGLLERADDQLGLYTEGFREVIFTVLKRVSTNEIGTKIFDEVFGLLNCWKEHVIHGVENRHELVPELLKMIPLFVKVGANEEADNLYRYMLGVSMGPSWYKEDQLGLMESTLRKMPLSDDVHASLPLVAGYLERASGEMTFQRFVRYEKMALIGELFRRKYIASGCHYFKRQTCGTTSELLLEARQGTIDKLRPMVGMRYPGAALDEQHAILEIVRNTEYADWRLCWSLLEIYQCGDERHFDDFASEYAKLINRAGTDVTAISEMVRRVEFVVGAEIAPKQRTRFLKSFRKALNKQHYQVFSKIITQDDKADMDHDVKMQFGDTVNRASTVEYNDTDIDDKFYFPGTFGKQSATREADATLVAAEKQLKLRNLDAAKTQAVKVLKILQDGGWSIWGGRLGNTHQAAEELLRQHIENPVELICAYAPLIAAERYDSKWSIAEHLIEKVADLLDENERSQVLQYVIDHVHLMVGDATNEIAMFDFLSEKAECDISSELFKFVIWLLDHPKSLRRDKAAGMIAWLVERNPSAYLDLATKEAFSMASGFSADIFCGVLDSMSTMQPLSLWDQIYVFLDMDDVLQNCQHVSRLTVLHRIADRAGKAGSSTGHEAASRIVGLFRSGNIEFADSDNYVNLPSWAHCIKNEWKLLERLELATKEIVSCLEDKMGEICLPLNIQENWDLENAVSIAFRETKNRHLNRWESKVRFALNVALFPYASQRNFMKIESALRVFNPSIPELSLIPDFSSPANAVLKAISSGKDYRSAIGDQEYYFLAYNELTEFGDDGKMAHLEVLATIVPSILFKDNFFLPPLKKSFKSKQIPNFSAGTTYHETCWHLKPDFVFFGSFTPGFPLPIFKDLIKAKETDFYRVNWRNGRSDDFRFFARPMQEGCLLAVRRNAVQLPDGKKLAWIIRINGELAAVVDSQNNQLI
ncbi:AVAST type 1 anti-phage system protease Avs1b [Methylomonas sp. YC3]